MIKIKIHEAYRKIVAVCDSELIGKKFVEGKLQLDLKESFYNGEEVDESKAVRMLKEALADDATFNIAGEKAIQAAIKAGIIDKKGIIRIQNIPYALSLI
jgi:hypothetical protein